MLQLLLFLHQVNVLIEQFVFQENKFDNENLYNVDFHRLVLKEFFVDSKFLDEDIHFLIEDSE